MKSAFRFALLLTIVFTGCVSVGQRQAIFEGLSYEPIARAKWCRLVGAYSGSVRSTSSRFGSTGIATSSMRLELYGTPDAPLVFLRMRTSASSAFAAYSERIEAFTNIPERRFGVKASVFVSSHAPCQLFIALRPEIMSPARGTSMLLTFHSNGCVEVEMAGHFVRRGFGTLHRLPFGEPCL